MIEFVTGLVLGGLTVFCLSEVKRWKMYITSASAPKNPGESIQWQNLMNYDGSERRQKNSEY